MTEISSVDLPVPAVALAVGAHPDDIELGCGATLAKWSAAGCRIHHLVCTDGAKGSWDPGEDTAALVAARREEQRRASRALGGAGEVTFLDWPDGELGCGLAARRQVAEVIRRARPDVVLGHDPWKRWRLHPDHRHAGFLVTDGIVAGRDPHFFPDLELAPHRPSTLLLFEADTADHAEDVTGYESTKIRALLEHRTQWRSTLLIDGPEDAAGRARFEARVREKLGEGGRAADSDAAEVFKLVADL